MKKKSIVEAKSAFLPALGWLVLGGLLALTGCPTPDDNTNPGSTNPGSTDPGSTNPGNTDPGSTDPGDTRAELIAGGAVNVAYTATTASVTFTGATGLTLTEADFTVTAGGTIGTVARNGNTVTVPVTFAANTDKSAKTYTVGINSASTKIKGSATVTITQATDTRGELIAGDAADAAYTASTASVTFTGAAGLTLTAADFTVTAGGTIGIPAVNGNTVTVPVTLAENTGTSAKTYTVGINSASTTIKGSATVTITQVTDTRGELIAGDAADAAYTASTASVTFTGAAGLTLTAADFTVTADGTIGIPAVNGNTVTVPVTFAENTGTSAKTYTVGINSASTTIKGSATVTITQATDTREELIAGNAVDAAYTASTASVTFTGATGLTLTAADFTVTADGTMDTVAVNGNTVTVNVTFAANTDKSAKTYTVGINSASTAIKGSATVTITQADAPATGTAKVIYTWANRDEIVTSATTATLSRAKEESLTITVTDNGYSNYQWSVNGGDVAAPVGTAASYTFSSAGHGNGDYTIGLRLTKGSAWRSAQITVTVQD